MSLQWIDPWKGIQQRENCRWDELTGRCRLRRNNQGVPCKYDPTTVADIESPITGRKWMDRNLGAWQQAQSPTDMLSYGDLYQYGRRTDGHQCRLSETSSVASPSNIVPEPDTSKFITSLSNLLMLLHPIGPKAKLSLKRSSLIVDLLCLLMVSYTLLALALQIQATSSSLGLHLIKQLPSHIKTS
jgi:hypothetical protein